MSLDHSETSEIKYLQKEYSGNWVWRAVASMIGAKGITFSEVKWAKLLGVSVEDVMHALDGLVQLGIIRRTAEGYDKILKYVYITDKEVEPKTLMGEHVLISTQMLGRLRPYDKHQANFYRTSFLAANRAGVKKYCESVASALQDLVQDSQEQESDGVYAITFSSLNILEEGELK